MATTPYRYVDDLIGRPSSALEATGHRDDTVIIFTSNHGDFLGDAAFGQDVVPRPSSHVPLAYGPPSSSLAPAFGSRFAPDISRLRYRHRGEEEPCASGGRSSVYPLLPGKTEVRRTFGRVSRRKASFHDVYGSSRRLKFIFNAHRPPDSFRCRCRSQRARNLAPAKPELIRSSARDLSEFDIERITMRFCKAAGASYDVRRHCDGASTFPGISKPPARTPRNSTPAITWRSPTRCAQPYPRHRIRVTSTCGDDRRLRQACTFRLPCPSGARCADSVGPSR